MVQKRKKKKKKKSGNFLTISIAVLTILLVIVGINGIHWYNYIFKPNVLTDTVILIPTNSSYDDVIKIVVKKNFIDNINAFEWLAKKKDYPENVKPGRYELKKGMDTNEVINILRNGKQTPVKLTFNNIRTFEELAGRIARYIEPDSNAILTAIRDSKNYTAYKFNKANFSSMFIPNTYEFFWNTSATDFIDRMNLEYNRFWIEGRIGKAKKLGLSREEIITLASIVQEETKKNDEKPVVAGLYLNRLKRGMLLQADPTVKYALRNFAAKRVTNDMLQADSPYNTYKYSGLPPGPINFPEISSIDAVLNAESHNYIYMCAKEDFSGYHNFATNLSQHNANAVKYRNELNRRKIWK